jgi:hypothetical protein
MRNRWCAVSALVLCVCAGSADAAVHEVGPGRAYEAIGDVPWESLAPGDVVLIHGRSTPYREKWTITRQGTASAPIVVRGVPGPDGRLPVIDGNGAVTRLALSTWGEERFVIKIGGSSIPADTMPRFIRIERLDIRNASAPNTFTDDDGAVRTYAANAAAVFIEKGEDITIRNCILSGSGNGLFVASAGSAVSRRIAVEGSAILQNGNAGSLYEHNVYTEALGIRFEGNYLGPLRAGALGNNLKDRSAGLVVRYNWIAGGNRQLDLVESDNPVLRADPAYAATFVYGNVLLEPAGAGNRQMLHYGGDGGDPSTYRKGTLYVFNNTLVSARTDRTTVMRLSTGDERADFRHNVVYTTAPGSTLSILDASGTVTLIRNWLKAGWVGSFATGTPAIVDDGSNLAGENPGFRNLARLDLHPAAGSALVDRGGAQAAATVQEHPLLREYREHLRTVPRLQDEAVDLGAFELAP